MYITFLKFSHLAQVRKYFGLTQSQLGQLLGVSKNTVSDWENGAQPSLDHFVDLCRMFSLPYQFFLDYNEFSFEDIALCLDVYYSSSNVCLDDQYCRWFSLYPVSSVLKEFYDDSFPDDFSWISEFLVLNNTFHVFDFLYCCCDYSPPSRFSSTFFVWRFGGDQNA